MDLALAVALDIETTGLNPWEHRVVTAAFASEHGDQIEVFDDADNERKLLEAIEHYIYMLPPYVEELVTWNGTEFDIPFLAVRMALNGVRVPPHIWPSGRNGKYGTPIYDGSWLALTFIDVAYMYEDWCKDVGVKWSLKPVAEHLGKGIVSVDFSEIHSILDLTSEERQLYCVSDAQLTLGLYEEPPWVKKPRGQAVGLEGGMSIL